MYDQNETEKWREVGCCCLLFVWLALEKLHRTIPVLQPPKKTPKKERVLSSAIFFFFFSVSDFLYDICKKLEIDFFRFDIPTVFFVSKHHLVRLYNHFYFAFVRPQDESTFLYFISRVFRSFFVSAWFSKYTLDFLNIVICVRCIYLSCIEPRSDETDWAMVS